MSARPSPPPLLLCHPPKHQETVISFPQSLRSRNDLHAAPHDKQGGEAKANLFYQQQIDW